MNDDSSKTDGRIRRFHPARIAEHWLHVVILAVLVFTGLSQQYYTLEVSQWFILNAGGIDNVRILHRFAGILCSLSVLAHVLVAVWGIVHRRWQPTIVITNKDFSDAMHNIKFYLGAKHEPVQSGRYTYKQKFEYWAILTGLWTMMATGFILWFPTIVTLFLPGEVIPAAKVLHTNEALVVLLILALWHIYNAIFSPDVFPLDTSIFTGCLSKERMEREHALELAEIEQEKKHKNRGKTLNGRSRSKILIKNKNHENNSENLIL